MASQQDIQLERMFAESRMKFKNNVLKIVMENDRPQDLAKALTDFVLKELEQANDYEGIDIKIKDVRQDLETIYKVSPLNLY